MDLVINGQLAVEHNLILDDYPDIPQADHNWTATHAPGADSSLYQDNGYNDVKWTVNLSLVDFHDIYIRSVSAMNWIKQATRVSVDEWPFEYVVKTVSVSSVQNEWGITQAVKVEFTLESFKYLKGNQQIELDNGGHQKNFGSLTAKPLWKITGTAAGTVKVNDQMLQVLGFNGDLIVDANLMIANHENLIKGDYLTLDQQDNVITWDGGIQTVTIEEARWRSE